MTRSRWIPLAIFGLLAVLLAAGVWQSRKPDREALPSPLIGKATPEFALPSLHQPERAVRAADLRGAPYVLNVWGSWCPACREEHPVITRFAETKRVRIVGYDLKDAREDALRWLEQFGNPYWLVIADEPGTTAIDFGIYGAPETFLIDATGRIRWKHVGPLTDAIIANELLPKLHALETERGA
ncbi:DsbE family thiol:disulfide interchange protein [Lysobacter sp. TY2-98]|uniref:DsbE family thiol:disulfide interchange protein n=1 Tax=Lysobacter sp. TY2-98 TaxID=2290922 RepID=UPI000E204D3F|nr:DsbE family thiol:disulfide interchange protein [Lysobacter sp. TY2-98]AXK71736.1 DsbE family thiol:disulfide interchange protein [Lysobacter sp. TY2-98]